MDRPLKRPLPEDTALAWQVYAEELETMLKNIFYAANLAGDGALFNAAKHAQVSYDRMQS